MSTSKTVAPHLPYLRRFARALSGSQTSGDAYVVSFLEMLVEDPSVFRNDGDPRVSVYRTFLKLWNSIDVNLKTDVEARPGNVEADRKLEAITPRPRQAFLLSTVEEFTVAEVAQILDISEKDVAGLIDEAGHEIAQLIETDVLVIEDEPMIAMDLETIVESMGHRVTTIARTQAEATRAAKSHRPGLILADIQLADGTSGIDAVNEMLQTFEVPVIFITAYPEQLLSGRQPEPTFLITKPYRSETVKAVISQTLFFDQHAHLKAAG